MNREMLREKWRSQAPLIAPSLLKCDFANLGREISDLEAAGAELLHWDVMDGHFVPNLSYGAVVIERLRDATKLPFDAHLMISDPGRYLDTFVNAGCDAITIHIEAVRNPGPILRQIREAGALAGLSLNPGTPVAVIEPYLSECDLVLVMSVEPGFGGQQFQPAAVEKVRQVRSLVDEQTLISIDGGISAHTIPQCADAGVDIYVVGSAIFESPDYRDALEKLTALASLETA